MRIADIITSFSKTQVLQHLHFQLVKPLRSIYIPSWESLKLILVIFILIPYWDLWLAIYTRSPKGLHNWSFTSHMEYMGWIGTFVIALAIFIAEQFSETTLRGKAFLRETLLWPILVISVFGAIWIFFLGKHFYSSIIVVGLTIFIGLGFYKLLKLLLSNKRMIAAEQDLLKTSFTNVIEDAFRVRRTNILLLSEFGYEIPRRGEDEAYWAIESETTGVVSEVDIPELRAVIKQIKNEAIAHTESPVPLSDALNNEPTQEASNITNSPIKIGLCRLAGSYVGGKSNTLLTISGPASFSKEFKAKLRKRIQSAFTIISGDSLSDELKREIYEIKDELSAAISAKALGRIDELLSIYIELADAFSGEMNSHGVTHNHITADHHRHSIENRWAQLEWLTHDLYEIFSLGLASRNKQIIDRIAHVPFEICSNALNVNDHYVYQEFLILAEQFLEADEIDPLLLKRLADSFRLSLQTIANFHLSPKIEREESPESPLLGFAFHQFLVLQRLLKLSLDRFKIGRDRETYKTLFTDIAFATSKLFSFMPFPRNLAVPEKIISWRKEMFFGLGAWILKNCFKATDRADFLYFWVEVSRRLPKSVEGLSSVYLQLAKRQDGDLWHTSHWDIPSDGEAHFVDTFDWVTKEYLVLSLEALSSNAETNSPIIPEEIASYSASITDAIRDLKSEIHTWINISPACTLETIKIFESLLATAVAQRNESKAKEIRGSRISPEKLTEFANKVENSFKETAWLRMIIAHYKHYTDSTHLDRPEISPLGISSFDLKEPFLTKSDTIYFGWGENYGQSIARGETQRILDTLTGKCETAEYSNLDNIIATIGANNAVILSIGESSLIDLHRLAKVKMNYEKQTSSPDSPNPDAYYGEEIPIYNIPSKAKQTQLLVIDNRFLGELIQYSPYIGGKKSGVGTSILKIEIEALSDNESLLKEFLGKRLPWLVAKGTPEQQADYLKEKVLIQIQEKYEFKLDDNFRGFLFSVERPVRPQN